MGSFAASHGVQTSGVSAIAFAVLLLLIDPKLQVYSLAWKAATGVAAAEGLAIGGWSCKNVRVQQAEAAKSAAELARLRKQAAQELTALRALLQQQEAAHTHEVREGGGGSTWLSIILAGWCCALVGV